MTTDSDIPIKLWIGVNGHPRPQPRPRGVGGKGKARFISTMDKKARLWAGLVEADARQAMLTMDPTERKALTGGPVTLRLDFLMPVPASGAGRIGKPHDMKPDADNLAKLVMDALERAGVLGGGDCKVASLTVTKTWHNTGGVVVNVSTCV